MPSPCAGPASAPIDKDGPDHTIYSGELEIGRIYQTRGGPESMSRFWSMIIRVPMTRSNRWRTSKKAQSHKSWDDWKTWANLEDQGSLRCPVPQVLRLLPRLTQHESRFGGAVFGPFLPMRQCKKKCYCVGHPTDMCEPRAQVVVRGSNRTRRHAWQDSSIRSRNRLNIDRSSESGVCRTACR